MSGLLHSPTVTNIFDSSIFSSWKKCNRLFWIFFSIKKQCLVMFLYWISRAVWGIFWQKNNSSFQKNSHYFCMTMKKKGTIFSGIEKSVVTRVNRFLWIVLRVFLNYYVNCESWNVKRWNVSETWNVILNLVRFP